MKVISINSLSAFKLLEKNNNYHVIDVRTEQEWRQGVPKIDNLSMLSWRLYPDMVINEQFYQVILNFKNNVLLDNAIFFICRSGIRSYEAASLAADLGISNCYNIIDGFEGNSFGLGWKKNDLPYYIPEKVI